MKDHLKWKKDRDLGEKELDWTEWAGVRPLSQTACLLWMAPEDELVAEHYPPEVDLGVVVVEHSVLVGPAIVVVLRKKLPQGKAF